jgi:hypothetical protein
LLLAGVANVLTVAAGNLLDDPGFEAGLGRWQASDGARLARVGGGRSGEWAANLAAGGSTGPSMAIRDVRRCQAGKAYTVAVWLRASRPGAWSASTWSRNCRAGATRSTRRVPRLVAGGWEPLEVVHVTHRSGAALAIEVTAVELPTGATVFVDDLELGVTRAASKPWPPGQVSA